MGSSVVLLGMNLREDRGSRGTNWRHHWELGRNTGNKTTNKIQTPPSPKEEIRSSWMHVELSHLLSEISIPKFA
jgi:hypothetical protein